MNRILGAQTMKRSFQLMGLLIAFTCSSFAGPITFTDLTTASGTIGSTPFTDAAITITGIGDTSNIQSFSGGFFINDNSASIMITGVGTFDFITATRFFVNNLGEIVGFSRAGSTGLDLIDGPSNSAFSSWGMLTSIRAIYGPRDYSPVAGQPCYYKWRHFGIGRCDAECYLLGPSRCNDSRTGHLPVACNRRSWCRPFREAEDCS